MIYASLPPPPPQQTNKHFSFSSSLSPSHKTAYPKPYVKSKPKTFPLLREKKKIKSNQIKLTDTYDTRNK